MGKVKTGFFCYLIVDIHRYLKSATFYGDCFLHILGLTFFAHNKTIRVRTTRTQLRYPQKTKIFAIQNTVFVKANAMNNSAKFQLYLPYGFWGMGFLIFIRKFSRSAII